MLNEQIIVEEDDNIDDIVEYYFEITELRWERVFLHIKIKTECDLPAEFAICKGKKRVNIEYRSHEEGEYYFKINVAAFNGRSFLNNGAWKFFAYVEERKYECFVTSEIAYRFDELSRIFPYGKNRYSYNVFFTTGEAKGYTRLILNSNFMKINKSWSKRNYVEEAKTKKGKMKRFVLSVNMKLIQLTYNILSAIFPKKGKNILLMSENKPAIWGNLKYLDDGLKARGLDKEFNIYYNFRIAVGKHSSIFSWIKIIYLLSKQDYVFVDDYVPIFGFLDLNKKTKLIQVWHAGEGFKSVGYSRFGKAGSPYPCNSCHKKYDYVLVGSSKLIDVYAEVFGIEREAFLPVGMLRLDGFLDEKKISDFKESFYKEYPNLKNKKIILFAPTFRGTGQKNAKYNYNWIDLKQIYDFCGDEYVFLIKMHPFVRKPIEIPEEYSDRIIDFLNYPNINDLYYVTEVLITDYSSNYYEFSLMRKPIVFYTPDREMYELHRGVHRSVKECAPGPVCDTFEEMMEVLQTGNYEQEKLHKFIEDNFGEYDGKATERAIAQILNR